MNEKITIHDQNGTDAITVPLNMLIEQIRILGVFRPVEQLVQALAEMGRTKHEPQSDAYKKAVELYVSSLREVKATILQVPYTPPPAPQQKNPSNVGRCKGCGAEIVWLASTKGGKVPVNVSGVRPGDQVFVGERHTSHMTTCTNRTAAMKKDPRKPNPKGHTEATADLFMPKK